MRLKEIAQNKSYDIIDGPGLLFIGANGHRTYGIKIRSLSPKSEVEDRGYKREWHMNDHTLAKADVNELARFLGVTKEEANGLKISVANLSVSQE